MTVRPDPVPEPSTCHKLSGGLAALPWARRRRLTLRRLGIGAMLATLAGAMTGVAPAHAAAPAAYTVTPYPPFGAGATATEMNQRGHMLGIHIRTDGAVGTVAHSPFLTTPAGFVDIGQIMSTFTPAGLNDLDQVAGTATRGGPLLAYLLENGAVRTLGTMGDYSGASAINNTGQVAGFSGIAGTEHAFLYQNGAMQDIGSLGVASRALDINEQGQVVGQFTDAAGHTRAFIYDNDAMRDLGTLGGDFARATDIGNGGHVLGMSTSADGTEHNFIYYQGVMTALADGAHPIRALGINSIGDAVGSLAVGEGADRGAYLWSEGKLFDIASMIKSEWEVHDAVAINDLGQIAATGCLRGSCSAVLLSPVPEPEMPAMLLAGLAALGLLRLKRTADHSKVIPLTWTATINPPLQRAAHRCDAAAAPPSPACPARA